MRKPGNENAGSYFTSKGAALSSANKPAEEQKPKRKKKVAEPKVGIYTEEVVAEEVKAETEPTAEISVSDESPSE